MFARPIGQFVVADVLKLAGIQGKSINDAIDAIMTGISMNIDDDPWVNVIWNTDTQTIEGGRKQRKLVVSLIGFALGLKGTPKVRELTKLYRDITGDKKANVLPSIEWSGSVQEDEEVSNDNHEEQNIED